MIHNKVGGIGIILLKDLLCGITSYYFSIDLRFDCIFKWVIVGSSNDYNELKFYESFNLNN